MRGGRPAPRVLVLGPRDGLLAALRGRGVPFALWTEAPLKKKNKDALCQKVAPFPSTPAAAKAAVTDLEAHGPYTHVIAGAESAVVAASYARRAVGARASTHTVAMRCHDKLYMKQRLREAGVPVTEFVDLNRASPDEVRPLGTPLVVKDRRSSGSRGVEILEGGAEAIAQVARRNRLAERFVDGREMSVESFVVNGELRFVSTTLYWRPKHVNVVPAPLDDETAEAVLAVNQAALSALRIAWGITHLELFLTADGPVVGEVALRPPGGYLMEILEEAWGFDAWDAFVAVELDEDFTFPAGPPRPTAAVIFHPGEGRVTAVRGEAAVRARPEVRAVQVKVGPGDLVRPRVGIGVDVGRVILGADSHRALIEAVRFVEETLVFEVAPA